MSDLILVVIAAVVGFLLGGVVAEEDTTKLFQEEAVAKECGLYHPQTGEFVWLKDYEATDSQQRTGVTDE